jgi:pimeloyl-ACP methyl ester carboxylesterase
MQASLQGGGMTRRHGPLLVHEYGEAGRPVLLLLHGITDSGECWADLVERLGSSYSIVAPDALGHGGSDRWTPDELAAEDPTEIMYAAHESLLEDVGPALVMGHSMGGGQAAALAARRPDLVRATVLEDPVWLDRWGGEDDELRERIQMIEDLAGDQEAALARARAENPTWPESEYLPWARAKAAVDQEFVRAGVGVLHTPWREIAAAIRPPTLVITGDREVILHAPALAAVADLENPALEVHVVPGAGHGIRRERPDDFHALVDPFLAAHAG